MPQNHHKIVQITKRGPKPPPQTNCSQASVVPKLSTSTARAGDPPPLWRPNRVQYGAYHLGTAGQPRGAPWGPFKTLFPLPSTHAFSPLLSTCPSDRAQSPSCFAPAPPTLHHANYCSACPQASIGVVPHHATHWLRHYNDTTMQVRPSCAGSLHACPTRHRPNNQPPASASVLCIAYLHTQTHYIMHLRFHPCPFYFSIARAHVACIHYTMCSHLCCHPPTPSSPDRRVCTLSKNGNAGGALFILQRFIR